MGTNVPIGVEDFEGIKKLIFEKDISLVLDGNYVLPEWDPEEDILTGILSNSLSMGNHVLTVSISDRSGNTTRKAVYFKTE